MDKSIKHLSVSYVYQKLIFTFDKATREQMTSYKFSLFCRIRPTQLLKLLRAGAKIRQAAR